MKMEIEDIFNIETDSLSKKLAFIKYAVSLFASRARLPLDSFCAIKAMKALHSLAEEVNVDIGKDEFKLIANKNAKFVFTAIRLNNDDNTKCDEECLFLQKSDNKCKLFNEIVQEFKRCEKCIEKFKGKSREYIYQDMKGIAG